MLPPHNVKNLININSQISAFYLGIGTFEASIKICREFFTQCISACLKCAALLLIKSNSNAQNYISL